MLPLDPTIAAIGVGLVVCLLFTELFGLAAGGMVVPGYLALSLDQPWDIALTFAASLMTYGVVALISQRAIVYGRRRIVLMLLFGFLFGCLMRWAPLAAGSHLMGAETAGEQASVIGYIIPGLIALWCDRQGVVGTFSVVTTASVVVRLVLVVLGWEAL